MWKSFNLLMNIDINTNNYSEEIWRCLIFGKHVLTNHERACSCCMPFLSFPTFTISFLLTTHNEGNYSKKLVFVLIIRNMLCTIYKTSSMFDPSHPMKIYRSSIGARIIVLYVDLLSRGVANWNPNQVYRDVWNIHNV